ncbi:MAG TPA: hypothetical protein DCP66_00405, partial [Collinsella sp.]|nr:hypothetical protein [Collinsella sp.]
MIDIAEIFGSKALDEDKLLARGFDGDGEEYLLASVRNATGSFVGRVHLALEKILRGIASECFHTEHFKQGQTKRMLALIEKSYVIVN